ncbi:MAG: sugar ABC transporter permease [Actinobacteria bacterium]|nr:sugar ABC transporter permease [Actinomycetota bacterium]
MKSKNFLELNKFKFASATAAYLAPALILYFLFVIVPGFMSIFYSFTNWSGVGSVFKFIGFENFKKLFADSIFLQSIKNNFIYLFFNGAIQNTIALLYAVALNEKLRGYKVYRAIIFLPFVLTPVGVGISFIYLLHPVYGVIRKILDLFHITGINVGFLGNPHTAVFAIAVVQIWLSMGVMVLVWLAGLQNLNKDLIAAAQIDGANNFQVLKNVIVPLLTPSILIVTVLTIVGNFKAYDLPWAMTAGGPGYSTYFTSIFIYKTAFEYYNFGYAMSASAVIFFIPLVLIILAYIVIKKFLPD